MPDHAITHPAGECCCSNCPWRGNHEGDVNRKRCIDCGWYACECNSDLEPLPADPNELPRLVGETVYDCLCDKCGMLPGLTHHQFISHNDDHTIYMMWQGDTDDVGDNPDGVL